MSTKLGLGGVTVHKIRLALMSATQGRPIVELAVYVELSDEMVWHQMVPTGSQKCAVLRIEDHNGRNLITGHYVPSNRSSTEIAVKYCNKLPQIQR